MKQEMMGWQWHQLDHTQIICTLLQSDNHASISLLIFTGRMLFLTPNQQEVHPACQKLSDKVLAWLSASFNIIELHHC